MHVLSLFSSGFPSVLAANHALSLGFHPHQLFSLGARISPFAPSSSCSALLPRAAAPPGGSRAPGPWRSTAPGRAAAGRPRRPPAPAPGWRGPAWRSRGAAPAASARPSAAPGCRRNGRCGPGTRAPGPSCGSRLSRERSYRIGRRMGCYVLLWLQDRLYNAVSRGASCSAGIVL